MIRNRIDILASLTKDYETVADIGCDHAYTAIKSVLKYGVQKVYACDINELPLKNALGNIKKHHLEDKIDIVLSDGLTNLDEICDVVLISGMGGILIAEILEKSLSKIRKAKKLILQPNSEKYELRTFLNKNNLLITDEFSFYDKKKYYEIIVCNYEEKVDTLDEMNLHFGPMLLKKRTLDFIKHHTIILNDLKSHLPKASTSSIEMINNKIKLLNEVIKNE